MLKGGIKASLVAVLEAVASERPEVLGFVLDALSSSFTRPAVRALAAELGVPLEQIGPTLHRASVNLDRLEKRRSWRNPGAVLDSPNLAALLHVCGARSSRIDGAARQRRLQIIHRKLERAHNLARTRAWIDEFLGEPLPSTQEARSADR